MVHLNKPTTDYPQKALDRLYGNTVQSDLEAYEKFEAAIEDIVDDGSDPHNVAAAKHDARKLAAAIRDYVAAVASKIRPEDRG